MPKTIKSETIDPIRKVIQENYTCPHDMGRQIKCGEEIASYHILNKPNLAWKRIMQFTCYKGHTWTAPIIED